MSLTSRKAKIAVEPAATPPTARPRRGRPPMLGRRRRRAAGSHPASPGGAAPLDEGGIDLTGVMADDLSDDGGAAADRREKRRGRYDDDSSFLGKYFRDMSALEVMPPEQEFEAARNLEALEIEIWRAALSHPPAVDFVLRVVETLMDNSLSDFRTLRRLAASARRSKEDARKLERAVARVAPKLRSMDTDRQHLEALVGEIDRLRRGLPARIAVDRGALVRQGAPARAWFERVAKADRAAAEARNAFVLANLRLVVSIARRFNHGRMAL
ncbi:MAG TPA: hypothetical protein VKZ63_09380, partial [Kofleriaceae bacterium]|nr:hypothetical protein [Kofleriaceae bacterium]